MSDKPVLMLAGATAAARALLLVLQTCHWQAAGDVFYAHHLLFERLYNDVLPEVDILGEKAVGMSDEASVSLQSQYEGIGSFLQKFLPKGPGVPKSSDLVETALHAEKVFLQLLKTSLEVLEKDGSLTPGIENMLGGIADKHEEHVYLLQQVLR